MKLVLQRVSGARVLVGETVAGEIRRGVVILVGVADGDTPEEATRLAAKVAKLRIFEDARGKFDRGLLDVGGGALAVSQFTLFADTRKGNRPSFTAAARPEIAQPLFERFCEALRELGVPVQTGVFGARMRVELVNDGPVTVILD